MSKACQEIVERFKRLINTKRLAHAYLFTGPAGIGKVEQALLVAQMVNCEDEVNVGCGVCSSCKKISSGNHPDVYTIGAVDEEAIKIDEIRQMLGRVSLKPYEARVKVFILRNVDRMTTESANALLKTLEEPAKNTLIILTTAIPESCLDTIKSRCHVVKFFSKEDYMPEDRNRILDLFLGRGNNEEYLKELSADKHQVADAMLVLLSLVKDVLVYKSTSDALSVVNQERISDVKRMSQRGMDELVALNQQIVRVKALSDENLNVKMSLSLVRERIWGN